MTDHAADRTRTMFHAYAAITGLLLLLAVIAANAGTAAAPVIAAEEAPRAVAPDIEPQWRWERRAVRFDGMIREPSVARDREWIRGGRR